MRFLLGAGDRVRVIAPAAVTKDVGFLLGQMLLIPNSSAANGAEVECIATGEVWIAKTSALAISAGDALYWDDTNKVVNKTSAAQKEVGLALEAAANPSPYVRMLLVPTLRTSVAA
jgi:predicted RecA/RadA family phage recombinase